MKKDAPSARDLAELRQRAEARFHLRSSPQQAPLSDVDAQRLIHELQVHQIELELQNEELLETRAELEASRDRYAELYDFAPMGLFALSANGCIGNANLTGAHLLGQPRNDLLAVWLPAYLQESDHPAFHAFLRNVFAAGTPQSCEVTLKKDGRLPVVIHLKGTLSPDRHECRAVALDITDRKRLEEQVLRSQRMEGIGTLAGGIAHDLNNVLGPILMSLDVLKTRFTDSSSIELLDVIHASAQHGANLVRQVLSFARGVEGERLEVPVHKIIHDIEHLANETFLKHVQIRIRISAGLWRIVGDRTHLHQLLLNLCVNARDAMPRGGTLTIAAENCHLDEHDAGLLLEAQPGPYVLLQVQDTGTGMPPDVLKSIFDPFFTTKQIGHGTGLGLSTALGIVKSHGGFLRVKSEMGVGTTFSIYFPASGDAAESIPPPAPDALPCGHGELILVIDDERSVRHITQQTLETFGYRVVTAMDGADGIAKFAAQPDEIQAVLTDLMMPIMDGASTVQVLRKLRPNVPIIAASGVSHQAPEARARDLGVERFLDKPYNAATLLQALRGVLEN